MVSFVIIMNRNTDARHNWMVVLNSFELIEMVLFVVVLLFAFVETVQVFLFHVATMIGCVICGDCESFEQNPHKPNKQGRCRGTPWDDDTDQWPQLKHECGAFKRTASQEGK